MLTATKSTRLTFEQAQELSDKSKNQYSIEKINPHWPIRGATMNHLLPKGGGKCYSWSEWIQWTEDCLIFPDIYEYGYVKPENKLFAGTINLPIDVLQAAHKRLFGETTPYPCMTAVSLIGFALFNPNDDGYFNYRVIGFDRDWESLVRVGNLKFQNKQKAGLAIADLLKELE